MTLSPFETFPETGANQSPLTPVHYLAHTAFIYPEHTAVIHGEWHYNYSELYQRCQQLASALSQRSIGKGHTVSVIAPNIPAHLEAHFGVPMTGAVLNSINCRLDAAAISFILDHGECDVLLVDGQFANVIENALEQCSVKPLVIDINDPLGPQGISIGALSYEEFLKEGQTTFSPQIDDEWQALALNYTSGTTGNPKGVVYHHRGAYLNAMSNVLAWQMPLHPTYLWTLPMFHCNGWCFPWTITLQAGTHVCLREIKAESIIEQLVEHQVSHFCGAPIVLSMLANAPDHHRQQIPTNLNIMTAGAPPPASVIEQIEATGAVITHTYGLTEVYGPCVYCAWHAEWNNLPNAEQAALKARQGVPYPVLSQLDVLNPDTLEPVPADGNTMGEIMFQGNVVMLGYLKNPATTEEAFAGGWFHSGDLAVKHPDGYIEVRDRSKDIIISGGENISSIEVENTLYQHPEIITASVVAISDTKWGETPCAFVELKAGSQLTSEAVIAFCRDQLAHFKCPSRVVFDTLPKTSTGKIQKFVLRERAKALAEKA